MLCDNVRVVWGSDPSKTTAQRLAALETRLIWSPWRRQTMRILRALMATVDTARLEALRAKYAGPIATAHPDSPYKYLDAAFYVLQKLQLARQLGLDKGPPRRVLDIGTAGGHFPFVCRFFGHQVVAIDVDNPLYESIAACLGIQRTILRVEPDKPLPALGERFDLIVACNITFNEKDQATPRAYWSLAEWQYFLDDIVGNHLRSPGTLYVKLNKEFGSKLPGIRGLAYNRDLLQMAAHKGAAVNYRRGTFELSSPDRGASPEARARSSPRADERMRVLALGSCRIHEPLGAAHELGSIAYQNRRFGRRRPVYIHDVYEAIQFVRLVRGEIVMPKEIRPFAYEGGLRRDRGMTLALDQAEYVVVEACTDKHYEASGWTLNVNELYRQLVDGAGEAGQEWWKAIDAGRSPSEDLVRRVEAQLRTRWRGRWHFGEGHRRVLRELAFRYLSTAEIAQGLEILHALLARPVLVMPHIIVRLPDGTLLPERLQHVAKTSEAAVRVGLPTLDPRTFIDRHTQSRVLAGEGTDFNHYDSDYRLVVGCEIVRALRQ